jgi:hypothetical protein
MGSNGPPPKRKSSNENDLPISLPAPLTNDPNCSKIQTVKQESFHILFELPDEDNDKDQEN